MAELPVRKLPGVGKVNEMILGSLDIYTCRDLLNKAAEIYINFTEKAFDFLVRSALGLGKNIHEKFDQIKKSMSVCYSFKPMTTEEEINAKLETLIVDMCNKCQNERLEGRTLTFEFKNAKFIITQRSVTKSKFIGRDPFELRQISERIFNKVNVVKCDGLRMLCLRLTLMRDMDTGIVSEPAANIGLEETTAKGKTIHVTNKQAKSMAGGKTLNLMAGRGQKNVQPFQANVPFPLAV